MRPAITPAELRGILLTWIYQAWDGRFIGPDPWDVLARIWYSDWRIRGAGFVAWGPRVSSDFAIFTITTIQRLLPWPTSPAAIFAVIVAVVVVGGCTIFGFQRIPRTPLSREIMMTAAPLGAVPGIISGWLFFGDDAASKGAWCAFLVIVGAIIGTALGAVIAVLVGSLTVAIPGDQ
jgi:hypothetical protein